MSDLNWQELETNEQLQDLIKNSEEKPQLIFKHSTSCSISSMALNRFKNAWNKHHTDSVQVNYLDILRNRNISNEIADVFQIRHESPQLLLVKSGECIHDSSHLGISLDKVLSKV